MDKKLNDPKIIVAMDFPSSRSAILMTEHLDPRLCRLKVGKELFTACGPSIIEELMDLEFEVFLDLKFHDIPNTVAGAIRSAAGMGVWMVNLHCLGGHKMMVAAVEAVIGVPKPPKLIGVTVLTSIEREDLAEVGIFESPAAMVSRLAKLADEYGLDGVVCSPMEVSALRRSRSDKFILVTPGVRPLGSDANDQARMATPQSAIEFGSNYLVIGRPITQAKDPFQALQKINEEISLAFHHQPV